jgi:hypothetical protein
MLVLSFGPLSNSFMFLFFCGVSHLCDKYIYCFPVKFSKFIAWYGLLTVMDFVLIVVIDEAFMEQEGDLWKLYNYYEKAEKSGAIGLFITFLI